MPGAYPPGLLARFPGVLRNSWRTLVSMRTALMLLFMLAVGAIPGALLPQRSLNVGKVNKYLADRPTVGRVFDAVQLFDVFTSWWFTAVYALLFVSLVGCLTPRLIEHGRQMRRDPPLAPKNLARMPHFAQMIVTKDQFDEEQCASAIESTLSRWRVRRSAGNGRVPGATEIAAERGYAREFGNIVFHFGLLGLLIAIAVGAFSRYEGQVVLVASEDTPAFCNTTPAAFDSFRAGALIDGTELTQFCVQVKNFRADYLSNGQAEMFSSDITFREGVGAGDPKSWTPQTLKVNEPLRIDGDRVYLQGHGFAPRFTVTFTNGETRTDVVQWQPEDATTFLSSGAMRFDPPAGMYPDLTERRKNQIAIEGLFAPTASFNGKILGSSFPAMTDPAVAVDIYRGDAGLDTGAPQSLFSLDRALIDRGLLDKQKRVNLTPGETVVLDDGTEVRFDGAEEFVNLQISHDPAQVWVGLAAAFMMAGLIVSLVIKRRRIWARLTPTANGNTLIEIAGLARTDRAGWGTEFDDAVVAISRELHASPMVVSTKELGL